MRLVRLLAICFSVLVPGVGVASEAQTVILCLGDSITYGVVRSSRKDSPMQVDPLGGYPGRLQRRLGDHVRVLNRGIGGASTELWLTDVELLGPKFWAGLPKLWPGFRSPPRDPRAVSLASALLQAERPDVVVIFLGINDLALARATAKEKAVVEAAQRLRLLHNQARSVTPTVLVATSLPNHRDPAELQRKLNAQIRAAFPDYLPLGERFAAARWEGLLGDPVHPNERGHALLAEILADELVDRRLVAPVPEPTPARRSCADSRQGAVARVDLHRLAR